MQKRRVSRGPAELRGAWGRQKGAQDSPNHVDVNSEHQRTKYQNYRGRRKRAVPLGRGISTPLIGGGVFVRGTVRHHTVFYLAGLGDRILKASPLPPARS